MDYPIIYNEAMAKFAEAQKCQNEIVDCNQELQQVDNVINGTTNPQLYYQLKDQRVKLLCKIDEQTKDRDKKLNETLNKALDLADNETNYGVVYNSLGVQTATAILLYIGKNIAQWKCPIDARVKMIKLFKKGLHFLEIQRQYNWLWQAIGCNHSF